MSAPNSQRIAAEVGLARHKLRTSLSMPEFLKHLQTTNPARYLALWRENGPPDDLSAPVPAGD